MAADHRETEDNPMENISRDLTTDELVDAGYDRNKAKRLDALRERAGRFGGRVRVQRREGGGYIYIVDVKARISEEPALVDHMLEDAEQRVVALEQKYREA